MRKWMALLFMGLLGMAGYVKLAKPEPEDDYWNLEEDYNP